jgi:DNA-binding transcriptional ArsR family regulator
MKAKSSSAVIDSDLLENAGNRLRSMTHPQRIAIIELLIVKGKLSVTEIYKHFKIEQASASTHLKILKQAGILASQRDGKKIYYSVKMPALNAAMEAVVKCNAL